MSDEQAFLALMERFGIQPQYDPNYPHHWSLDAKEGGVEGYPGFACGFKFDESGKFVSVGVWE